MPDTGEKMPPSAYLQCNIAVTLHSDLLTFKANQFIFVLNT